ncbi:hypothetical protein MYXO_03469 [Myxococcaceae bacterium]|nr:hypothetical protein MYXO_03469 [Myxococcaceae bacterium]
MPHAFRRAIRFIVCALALAVSGAAPTAALDYFDGRLQVHGYAESQLRALSDGFRDDRWFVGQWAQILELEIEADLLPQGVGPFESVSLFVRAQARFDCIWSQMCGTMRSAQLFGNRSVRVPGNLANGVDYTHSGVIQVETNPRPAQNPNHNLIGLQQIPSIETLLGFGAGRFYETIAPVADGLYTTKRYEGSLQSEAFAMGPWQPRTKIHPIGQLGEIDNVTGPFPNGLPLRPVVPNVPGAGLGGDFAHNLYVPSQALLARQDDFGSFDQNFTQSQLQWNRGASQEQTGELKEAYLDIDMLEGRLFLRLGRQTIVWGKTELFPIVDQFNPYDFALSTLPSLEDSRIPLWSARAIYSLYDVGPLKDVRIEVGAILDRFQPNDVGKCGEPYAVWLVCGKSFGLLAHGIFGLGLAGEQRPADFYDDLSGLEIGARIEWRWERFSFALTDFWGYSDFPYLDRFQEYARRVYLNPANPRDPDNGRPLDVDGSFLTPGNALAKHPGNRQLFDVVCASTAGLAEQILPQLANDCFLGLLNSNIGIFGALTVPQALGPTLAGNAFGQFILDFLAPGSGVTLHSLNLDAGDGPPAVVTGNRSLSAVLTTQQMALLGCGPFYSTNCDVQGIDVFNAEASVLMQSFPGFEGGEPIATRFLREQQGPVATRFVDGRVVTIPGARTIYHPDWSALEDGCVASGAVIAAVRAGRGLGPSNAALCDASLSDGGLAPVNDLYALGFTGELQALSYNFLALLAAFGKQNQTDCDPMNPITCDFVTAFFEAAGVQRPEEVAGGNGRYGRRDFVWLSGGEGALRYRKRNVLGLSADFAEDVTKTNWGVELTFVNDDAFENTMEPEGFEVADAYNLVISVDRPTFVNFLNPGRTFLVNMQWFLGWVPDYRGQGVFTTNGPFTELGTLSILTGYYQDRLLPSVTVVHDVGSNSGAILGQVTYRFSDAFSATIGVSNFYGQPQWGRIPLRQLGLQNNGGTFEQRLRFNGLAAVSERDEVSLVVRYTF